MRTFRGGLAAAGGVGRLGGCGDGGEGFLGFGVQWIGCGEGVIAGADGDGAVAP